MSDTTQIPLSRRRFLRGILAGSGTLLLAACGGAASTAPTTAPAASEPTSAPAAPDATAAPTTAAADATAAPVEATAAPTAAEAAPTAAPAASGQPVEIAHWDWWVTQSPWLDNEIKLFTEANPDIAIKRTVQSGKFDDLLQLAFKDNSAPDVYFTGLTFLDVLKAGYALPISDFPDFADWKAGRPNPELDFAEGSNVLDGKTYTAPREARSAWWNQIYVNTAVLKKYGVNEVPRTLDAYLDAMRKVTKDSKGEAYGWANPLSSGWTPAMVWYAGQLSGAPFGGDNYKTGRYDFSSPAYVQVLNAFKTMKDEGLILPESSSLDDEAIRALFAEGKAAFFTGGIWCVPGWEQTHPDFADYTLMPPPLIGGTTAPVSYFQTGPGQTGTATYINAQTKNKEAAWKWFQWLHSRDAMKRWVASGNGTSLWTDDNDPNAAKKQVLKDFFANDTKINRVAPARSLRNPDVGKVNEQPVKPGENDIITGIYSGQITDIPGALAQLEKDKNASRDTAIADAVKAGAKVKIEDYAFSDWDPSKDYITKKA